ncbi:TRAP transporter TAXI family solute receptor [Paenarthrobacter nicotinovorans]|uniref:TAXI family TRAP transporter solute-binding subunit n=1 Tax=Paenarthrobacter nicotinovorans TaxID=29320 RepID=UPI0027874D62|nr:TAXI family TRAP transporter solute-binding subunit [Paenarthrobacter nicotinovorans]MDP9936046.1 TRAP transporter TAXI family solute receptor [Paenarthrobacter nicotinovorans]
MPDFPAISRRNAIRAAVSFGVLAAAVGCSPAAKPQELTVAGGEQGGFYLEFASLLADLLQRERIADKARALTTGGSLENIQRVLSGEATFAVALADAAAQPAASSHSEGRLVALGKVYQNYVHCIVRQDSAIRTFADLAGKTAGVGEVGSGTTLTAGRIIAAAGLAPQTAPPDKALKQVNLGLNQAIAALADGSIDVMIQSGGVPTAPIAAAAQDIGVRLLDLSGLIPATRAQSGFFYDRVLIPANSYGNAPAVWTVGVANLLLCRSDLADHVVRQTVELMVEKAQDLVPKSSAGVQFLSPETLINTAGVPLHPAAEAAYRALHG